MPDILVIGAAGLLGQYLMREAEAREWRATGTYASEAVAGLRPLDLTDTAAIEELVSRARPGYVALAAAMTSVDGCESRPDVAERINAQAPEEVAKACREVGARLVHFSTDYVFDGRKGPSDEGKDPNPLSAYGRTKLKGERNVLAALPGALVVRTCANFGWNRLRGKENSVTWILNRLRRGQRVPLFRDQRVSPSYAPHVARAAFDLAERGLSGIVHIATRSCMTRLEIGDAVCRAFSLPRDLLESTRLADANLAAPRPQMSCLSSRVLERFPDIPVPTFPEALEDMRRTE